MFGKVSLVHMALAISNITLRGVKLLYLPPYSPDFNPIKECFLYMKGLIWSYGEQFCQVVEMKDQVAIMVFLSDMLETVGLQHARGWFRHSNYL